MAPRSSERSSPPRSLLRQFGDIAETFLAMSGWRLRHLSLPWVLGGLASLALGRLLVAANDARASLAFFMFSLALYYVGNALVLTSDLPARLIRAHGEDAAFRRYEALLALMFINQGLGLGCISSLDLGPRWILPLPALPTYVLGAALFAIGLVVKIWATRVVGIDIYYYRDMFLGRRVSGFSASGPYKIFSNPMYGIGQLHAYGFAILNRSVAGVLATMVCHLLIYGFYFTVEKPFIRRVYLGPAEAA